MRYPTTPERVLLAGLADAEIQSRRRRVCASSKQKYAWLRFDTCTEIPKGSPSAPAVTSSKTVSEFLHAAVPFAGKKREFFLVLCVDAKNVPIAVAAPHQGGRASTIVDASVVLQAALLSGASSFIIAHNHPSDVPTPSDADNELTKRLRKGAEAVGLTLLDHVVLTDDPSKYFSYLDNGLMR